MLKINFILIFICVQTHLISQSTKVIDVYTKKDTSNYLVVNFDELFLERWDTLPQAKFWRVVMNFGPDSCIVNIAANRVILGYESSKKWVLQTEEEKMKWRSTD